jgi:hypothetical protein
MSISRTNQSEPENLTSAEGQWGCLCDDICSGECPSLSYESVISPDSDHRIKKAFDIVFQEVARIRKLRKSHETSSHIR